MRKIVGHIPKDETTNIHSLSFDEAIKKSQYPASYDDSKWINYPDFYTDYRYILGTIGHNPMITIGINPSTAQADILDHTLKSVNRVSNYSGYDSFIMFNVYAQRATKPSDMDQIFNVKLHEENMKAFKWALERSGPHPILWAAWGTLIKIRPYLVQCLKDMIAISKTFNVRWVTAGKKSKDGHPHHPLNLSKGCHFDDFDVKKYVCHL